jgi:GNAT superfamily N-acetyltransferase
MESANIRRGVTTDVPAITELWKEFMDFHASREKYFALAAGADAEFVEFVRTCCPRETAGLFVAEAGGQLVGYCLAVELDRPPVFQIKHVVEVMDLAVTARWRGRGVGARLVEKALAWARSRSSGGVEVRVATSNEQALGFWRRIGGRPVMEILRLDR